MHVNDTSLFEDDFGDEGKSAYLPIKKPVKKSRKDMLKCQRPGQDSSKAYIPLNENKSKQWI